MKHFSSETMRQHTQDLIRELKIKQTPDALRYYIINADKLKATSPMYAIASKQTREWPAVGLLDLHDLSQECYCALIVAWSRVNWDVINASSNPRASLWAYLKKSIKLDFRKAVNSFKDGMRVPLDKIWEVKPNKYEFGLDNFFSISVDNAWFLEHFSEALVMANNSRMSSWETEELYESLETIMKDKLSDTERLILEMGFGINELNEMPVSAKNIGVYFNIKEPTVRKIKERALKKLRTQENQDYLKSFLEN